MTKSEFFKKLEKEFSVEENALVNFNIYLSPAHTDYYIRYKAGDYQWCFDYLIKQRHLLTIENTPVGSRDLARHAIQSAILLHSK